jgi:tRNA 2-selenouridine synthase
LIPSIDNRNSIDISDAYQIPNSTWIDVRCPREFSKGHFTKAINIPLFTDDEYQKIGETYKQRGQEIATEMGLEYASKSSETIIKQISSLNLENIIIYCARGGMRSKGFQLLLDNAGYDSSRVIKGYKAIRLHTLSSFKTNREIVIIAGSTGTGKTELLHQMKKDGHNIIDLEKLANHRGSAFGDLGLSEQSTQQQFENDLSCDWLQTDKNERVFIESESRRIGRMVIPDDMWKQMLSGIYLKIDMNIDRRIKNLIKDYGHYSKNDLEDRIHRISKKLGGQNIKMAMNFLEKNNLSKLCELLLGSYYDKMYNMAYENRESKKTIIPVTNETNKQIIKNILNRI